MKKTINYTFFLTVCLLSLWVLMPVSNGLVVKMVISRQDTQTRNVFYIQKNKLKIVTENKSIIFFEDQLCCIDNQRKIFWKGNVKEFNKSLVLYRLGADYPYSSKSNLFYQNLSAKDSLFFNRIAVGNSGRKTELGVKCKIFQTPDFTSIAGYASRKFEIRQGNNVVEEVWISENMKNYLNYELNLDLYQDFMQSYLHHSESKLYYHLGSFMEVIRNGFPMRIKMYHGDNVTETTVENLIKKKIEGSVFIIPEGFKSSPLKDVLE